MPPPGAPAAGGAVQAPSRETSSGPIVDPDNLIGFTLNGRYRITEKIGEGGFGTVYKGEQIATGREVALKVLHPRMARDPQVVQRFRREAQATCALRNPHTVTTYDFDQTPERILYLAMEFLRGRSLQTVIQTEGPLPPARVAHILEQVCQSLSEAHAQGIVHRDIKPENIVLENTPGEPDYVKVLDFGIAKIVRGDAANQPALTAAGQTLGTLEYMSPEQLQGLQLDGRSDIYALGMMAYEMLTGRLPWDDTSPGGLIAGHISGKARPPSALRPDLGIPPEMDQIVLKMVEKDRERRFASVDELRAHLLPLCGGAVAPAPFAATPPPAWTPGVPPQGGPQQPMPAARPSTGVPAGGAPAAPAWSPAPQPPPGSATGPQLSAQPGKPVIGAATMAYVEAAKQGTKSKLLLLIVIIAVVLAGIATAGYLMVSANRREQAAYQEKKRKALERKALNEQRRAQEAAEQGQKTPGDTGK